MTPLGEVLDQRPVDALHVGRTVVDRLPLKAEPPCELVAQDGLVEESGGLGVGGGGCRARSSGRRWAGTGSHTEAQVEALFGCETTVECESHSDFEMRRGWKR